MKKTNLLLLAAFSICSLAGLSSCGKAKVTDVSIKEGYTKDVEAGEFQAGDYTIIETYSDGSTKEVAVTDDMIADSSKMKPYIIGEQQIEVVYLNTSIYITLNITRATFDVTMPEETITYDGNPHSLSLVGYYPKGTTISYPNGSSFTNVGTYTVEAVLTHDGYETKTVTSKITILMADYNLNVKFSDKTFTYDGEEHSVAIEGTLPSDVQVTYTINGDIANSATNAGNYEVTAVFSSSNLNYNPIPSMTATLTINKATYSTDGISIGKAEVTYTGQLQTWKIVNTLPSWITATYVNTYVAETGETLPKDCYYQKDVGFYNCTIKFTIMNSNYNTIPDMTFEVCIYEA